MLRQCLDGPINFLSQLLIEHFDTLPTQCRHIEHMHEGVWFPKNFNDKMAAMSSLTFFRLVSTKRGYACSMIVHTPYENLDNFSGLYYKGLCLFYHSA